LLHLEVTIVASGCAAAGWWQATRALAGNHLSWVYSVEWPLFSVLAIVGWWHLVHEDPEVYRARRESEPHDAGEEIALEATTACPATTLPGGEGVTVQGITARRATRLAALIGVECVLGIVALLVVPFGRPSGWLPARGEAIYVAHAIVGLLLALGALVLLVQVRRSTRTDRMVGWMGFSGVALAGIGGLLTEPQSLVRFLGMTLMFVGPMIAGLGYLIPALLRRPRRASMVSPAGTQRSVGSLPVSGSGR
jgi:hypothetical protein